LASSIPCCREGRTKHSLSVTPIQPFIMRASRLTHQVMLLQTFQLSPKNLIFQGLTLISSLYPRTLLPSYAYVLSSTSLKHAYFESVVRILFQFLLP
jgi:hypothetical protein